MLGLATLGVLVSGCSSQHSVATPSTCRWPPAIGRPAMPVPEHLTTTLSFTFNHVRLYPPPPRVRPKVSASQAWSAVRNLQKGATNKLVLAEWNSMDPNVPGSSPTDRLLVWVVMGTHVDVSTMTRSNTAKVPRCIYESAMWPVDATTGVAYGEMTFPSSGPVVRH